MADEVKKKRGRPPWTPEQREAYQKRRDELKKKGITMRPNFPQVIGFGGSPEDKEMIAKIIGEVRMSFEMPMPKNDDELEQRVVDYFELCERRQMIPTMEELSMYIGFSKEYVSDVRRGKTNGFSPRTKEICNRITAAMSAIDAKLAMTGRVRDAIYIFRSKNFYGMKDQQEVTFNANVNSEQEMSREDLENWFLEDGKKIETKFVDDEPKV